MKNTIAVFITTSLLALAAFAADTNTPAASGLQWSAATAATMRYNPSTDQADFGAGLDVGIRLTERVALKLRTVGYEQDAGSGQSASKKPPGDKSKSHTSHGHGHGRGHGNLAAGGVGISYDPTTNELFIDEASILVETELFASKDGKLRLSALGGVDLIMGDERWGLSAGGSASYAIWKGVSLTAEARARIVERSDVELLTSIGVSYKF